MRLPHLWLREPQLIHARLTTQTAASAPAAIFEDEVFPIDVAEPAQLISERGVKWTLTGEKTDAPLIHYLLPALGREIGTLRSENDLKIT